MPPVPPDPAGAPRAPSSTALTAFLHGIEPRAWVFALCQGGDPAHADQALAGAERDFIAESAQRPLGEWPLRFWAALLRQPGLLAELDPGLELSRLEPGPRAALLLRLLASLDVEHAAEALGVSLRAYEAALGQAMAAPGHPPDWLPSLRGNLQALVRELPAPTRAHLDEIRREALAHRAPAPVAAPGEHAAELPERAAPLETGEAMPAPRPRWPWFGLGLLLLALLATLLFPLPGTLRPGQSERLPKEVVPPPPGLSDTVVVTHPDYAQLAEPDSEGLARQLAFLSWLAAAFPAPATVAAAPTVPAPANFIDLSGSEQHMLVAAASVWPSLDAGERDALRANAADWRDRPHAQRLQLRARLLAWDRQAAAERARRRVPFLSWRELSVDERARVLAAQARLANLPATEQAALRAQFQALDADTQRVWWLGPALGQQLAPIAALFAFLPEADRPALLSALRGLEPAAREHLALLAPRLDEGQRQALRQQLLALPPERRADFIRRRLASSGAAQ
jgi:hypothetical protein